MWYTLVHFLLFSVSFRHMGSETIQGAPAIIRDSTEDAPAVEVLGWVILMSIVHIADVLTALTMEHPVGCCVRLYYAI